MNIFKAQACPLRRSMLQASACPQACSLSDPPLARNTPALLRCVIRLVCVGECVCVSGVCVCGAQTLGRAAKSASALGAPAPSLSRAVHARHQCRSWHKAVQITLNPLTKLLLN